MAFKTLGGTFYIIPRHTQKKDGKRDDDARKLVVGVKNLDMGQPLQLQELDFKNKFQQFRITKWENGFFMMIEPYNRYAIVHDGARHSHTPQKPAPIIQWEFKGATNPMLFQLLPAEDGYYRIMARHSGKFWDVYGAKNEVGAPVVQHDLGTGDNQLFSIIPVPHQPLRHIPPPLAETNNLLRTGILGAIGLIPDVGRGLAFIFGFFWKDNSLSDLWHQMQRYVEMRINQLIQEHMLDELGRKLEGIMLEIDLADKSDEGQGPEIRRLRSQMIGLSTSFKERPVEILPYLVSYGTIVLTLCHTMVKDYKVLFGHEASEKEATNNQEQLEKYIKLLTEEVNKCKVELMEWRLSQIVRKTFRCGKDEDSIPDNDYDQNNYWSSVYDHYEGWDKTWRYTVTRIGKYGDRNYRERAEVAEIFRKEQVRIQFASELDALTKASELWPDFNPKKKPRELKPIRKGVAIGGLRGNDMFDGINNEYITSVHVHADKGKLCGLEITYHGRSAGLHGAKGTETSLTLKPGEYISSVYGYAHDTVDGLWFVTNRGRIVGGGVDHSILSPDGFPDFCADLADGLGAKLAKISGSSSGGVINNLTFEWEYMGYPSLKAGYKVLKDGSVRW